MTNFNLVNNSLSCYDTRHLVMFSGKGGVGKTTLSCGFARRWAKLFPEEQILLILNRSCSLFRGCIANRS
jgi:arsenite-transporting ATPase